MAVLGSSHTCPGCVHARGREQARRGLSGTCPALNGPKRGNSTAAPAPILNGFGAGVGQRLQCRVGEPRRSAGRWQQQIPIPVTVGAGSGGGTRNTWSYGFGGRFQEQRDSDGNRQFCCSGIAGGRSAFGCSLGTCGRCFLQTDKASGFCCHCFWF